MGGFFFWLVVWTTTGTTAGGWLAVKACAGVTVTVATAKIVPVSTAATGTRCSGRKAMRRDDDDKDEYPYPMFAVIVVVVGAKASDAPKKTVNKTMAKAK